MAHQISREDDISCPVCFEIYIKPKTLPCYHTFCLKCLNGVEKYGRVECPLCRKKHQLPSGGPKCLPTIPLIGELIEKIQDIPALNKKKEVFGKCPSCSEKLNLMKCGHCDYVICRKCIISHMSESVEKLKTLESNFRGELQSFSLAISKLVEAKEEIRSNIIINEEQIDEVVSSAIKEIQLQARKMKTEMNLTCHRYIEKIEKIERTITSKNESTLVNLAVVHSIMNNIQNADVHKIDELFTNNEEEIKIQRDIIIDIDYKTFIFHPAPQFHDVIRPGYLEVKTIRLSGKNAEISNQQERIRRMKIIEYRIKEKRLPGEAWYMVSSEWYNSWRRGLNSSTPPIDNRSLLISPTSKKLRRNLVERRDYELLPHAAWKLLVEWYDCFPKSEIIRTVNADGEIVIYPRNLMAYSNSLEEILTS